MTTSPTAVGIIIVASSLATGMTGGLLLAWQLGWLTVSKTGKLKGKARSFEEDGVDICAPLHGAEDSDGEEEVFLVFVVVLIFACVCTRGGSK